MLYGSPTPKRLLLALVYMTYWITGCLGDALNQDVHRRPFGGGVELVLSGGRPGITNASCTFSSGSEGGAQGSMLKSLNARQTCNDQQRYCSATGRCCPALYNCVPEGCCEIPSNAYCKDFGCYVSNSYKCCEGGYICSQGETCMTAQQKCCFENWIVCGTVCIQPSTSFCCGGKTGCANQQVCCGGTCCDYGDVCGVGNVCSRPATSLSSSSTAAAATGGAAAAATQGSGTGGAARLQHGRPGVLRIGLMVLLSALAV